MTNYSLRIIYRIESSRRSLLKYYYTIRAISFEQRRCSRYEQLISSVSLLNRKSVPLSTLTLARSLQRNKSQLAVIGSQGSLIGDEDEFRILPRNREREATERREPGLFFLYLDRSRRRREGESTSIESPAKGGQDPVVRDPRSKYWDTVSLARVNQPRVEENENKTMNEGKKKKNSSVRLR